MKKTPKMLVPPQADYLLRLYVAGKTLKSTRAVERITLVCEEHLRGRYDLEVIDIFRHPHLARAAQIVAVPTLVRRMPLPLHMLVGDMTNINRVLCGLNLSTKES